MPKTKESIITQIDDVLENLETTCGGQRNHIACSGCPDYRQMNKEGFVSQCYYIGKAKSLLKKFRKVAKEAR